MTNEVELKGKSLTANPFGGGSAVAPTNTGGNAMMTAEMQRSIAEIQAQFMMALHRPRNAMMSVDKMLLECQRPTLAEQAIYSFPRGGKDVTGLSIRALEMVARNWGNMKYGFVCLERKHGSSLMRAYAYDLETNVPVERTFEVRHIRDKKGGGVPLTDERDIYELEASQSQRRVRACIEALIPADVLEAVADETKRTLEARADTSAEGIKKMLELFKGYGVNQKMIESRLQRNLSSITASQIVGLRSVYNSLKDGMSSLDQWFDKSLADSPDEKNNANAASAALKDVVQKSQEGEKKPDDVKAGKPEPKKQTPDIAHHRHAAMAATTPVTNKSQVNFKPIVDGILVMINEAKTIEDVDLAWNNHAEVLTELSEVDKSNFDMLDKLYLSKREALEKSQSQPQTLV